MIVGIAATGRPEKFAYGGWIVVTSQDVAWRIWRPADQMAQRQVVRRHLRLSSTVAGRLSAQRGPHRRTA
jgi:hypothetical protein